MKYSKIAKQIAQAEDSGAELVALLSAINTEIIDKKEGILMLQSIPEGAEPNPIINITVITNTATDFPAESKEGYIEWVRDYLKRLEKE